MFVTAATGSNVNSDWVAVMPNEGLHDYQWGWDGMSEDDMLRKMEPGEGWTTKLQQGDCGIGSEMMNTVEVRRALPNLMREHELTSIADVGAGDRNWMQHTNFPSPMSYDAFDLIPRHKVVAQLDCTTEPLPQGYDLILCRFVLNHLSPRLARDTLRLFQGSGSRYLLMTNCDNQRQYWTQHGLWPLQIGGKPELYSDYGKWDLELYHLTQITLP